MRYFLELSYSGKAYCGWQVQPGDPSVQQAVQQALSTLLRHETVVVGAGRTDTGVHASFYVAHFDAERAVDDPARFCYHLNAVLPDDIAVSALRRVRDDAHARFDAVQREYKYYVALRKDPFRRDTAFRYALPLDTERMNEAAALLVGCGDFTSFAKLHSNNKTNVCRVDRAQWDREGDLLVFTIAADRFLRNMVRALVGTLVDVGRGRYDVEEFRAIVESRDLSRASGGAPAEGLYLWDVAYPAGVFRRGERTRNLLFN